MKAMEMNSSTTFSQVSHQLGTHTSYKAFMPLNTTYKVRSISFRADFILNNRTRSIGQPTS